LIIKTIDAHPSILFFLLTIILIFLASLVTWLGFNFKKFRSRFENVNRAAETGDLTEIIVRQSEDIRQLQDELLKLGTGHNETRKIISAAIQKVGLVRFDAFDDIGGKLSFAAALLNERGDGVVISSINGRQESRIYAKPVKGGESIYNLSIEEKEAIGQALQ
jgi:hypothetical protein